MNTGLAAQTCCVKWPVALHSRVKRYWRYKKALVTRVLGSVAHVTIVEEYLSGALTPWVYGWPSSAATTVPLVFVDHRIALYYIHTGVAYIYMGNIIKVS